MGLFDKKYCDICGEKIGLLGNRKLEDGNMCKNCAALLSPWFSDRKQSTVEEIKEQLAYREENKKAVAEFRTTRTLGRNTKVLLDEDACKFMVTSARKISEANPDVLSFSDVTGCDVNVEETRTEIHYRDSEGQLQSFSPSRYAYSYDFYLKIYVNHPYFDEISFKLNDSSVDGGAETIVDYDDMRRNGAGARRPMAGSGAAGRPGAAGASGAGRPQPGRPGAAGAGRPQPGGARPQAGRPQPGGARPQAGRPQPGGARPMGQRPAAGYGGIAQAIGAGIAAGLGGGYDEADMIPVSNAADVRNSSEYIEYESMSWEIHDILLQERASAREEAEAANVPKQAVKCPYCGATTIPTENGCCEYCGAAL